MEQLFLPIVILITLTLLLFLLSMIWPPDSPWSPWWRTNAKTARALCRVAKITKDDVLYDLGCGDGTVLLTAAKQYRARGVGIEIDPSRVFIARLRMILEGVNQLVQIRREDIFKTEIKEASVVVVYLIPKTLNRLQEKFVKELKPGTRIVSHVYQIEYLQQVAEDKENRLYVYEISRNS